MFAHRIDPLEEVKQILLADVVLILGFSLTLSGGIFQFNETTFLYYLPIAALAVTLSFILHELMHKFVAQHYGATAAFQTSPQGLMITIITGAMGFLFGIPGATMIYTSRFTMRENGIVSIAGPLTNIAVFLAAFAVLTVLAPVTGSYLATALQFLIFISLLLGFFNMLPIPPLDGSKVLAWNKIAYVAVVLPLLALMLLFNVLSLYSVIFMIGIALFFSMFYRRMY